MGILTDFVALPPQDAASIDPAAWVAKDHGDWVIETKGIFDVELAELESLLTGTDVMTIIDEGMELISEAHGYSMVFEAVRPSLTNALASRASDDWSDIADRWEESETLVGSDIDILTDFLRRLAALAHRAVESDRRLYLWLCV